MPRPSANVPCSSRHEREARQRGHAHVAGVDEVGRGCLFGPVVAAAVVLSPDRPVRGLRDSKELPPERRVELAARIRDRAVSWSVAHADVTEIDSLNIFHASRLAMLRAVAALLPAPNYLLVDAVTIDVALPQEALVRGDARCQCIAAASIVAKVHRDAWLEQLDLLYPGYGLARHKGYGTPEHLRALRALGVTELHRRSFAPVREVAASGAASQAAQPRGSSPPMREVAGEVPCP